MLSVPGPYTFTIPGPVSARSLTRLSSPPSPVVTLPGGKIIVSRTKTPGTTLSASLRMVPPKRAMVGVTRLALHLDRARKQAFADHDLEPSEFDVLSALRRAGEPYQLSPGQLVHETLVTSGTMTNRVDRLTARNFVERLPDPRDRRGVLVRLTVEGKAAVDGAFEALLGAEADLLAELPDRDRARLAVLLRTLLAPFS